MKQIIKTILNSVAPNTFAKVQSIRSRQYIEKSCMRDGRFRLAKKIGKKIDNKVQFGPFQGMVLDPSLFKQHMSPKLIGTYESELHPFIFRAKKMNVDHVVNIGSAEGYYAVGACLLFRNAIVDAFDLDRKARSATAKHGHINGVESMLNVKGRAEPETIEELIINAELPFIISDCEGFEAQLLDLGRAPSLKKAIILCEMHPVEVPDIETLLKSRFDPTHEVQIVIPRKKFSYDYASILQGLNLNTTEREIAVNEYRAYTPWLVAVPFNKIPNGDV